MSVSSTATVNTTLTNFARGFAQDQRVGLADFIAPVVPTGVAAGQYKSYDDKNMFQVYDSSRAIGGPRKRIDFAASDPTFNCKPQGLEIGLDDHERNMAGEGSVMNLQQAKIRTLVNGGNVSHENKVWTAVFAGLAATGGVGVWSSASNDPVEEIDTLIEAIATETGMLPNRIAFGLGAWRVFKNHTKVIARQPGSSNIGVSEQQAAGMLLNPSIDIRVGIMSKDTTKFGATKSAQQIIGGEVVIFCGSDTPDQYDPSFAKTFSVDGSMVGAVKEYREEHNASDMYAVDWSEDIKVTASAAGRRITLS